jgi:hypothetical protein
LLFLLLDGVVAILTDALEIAFIAEHHYGER